MEKMHILSKLEKAIIDIELSSLDAHKKANVKAILYAIHEQCSKCEECQCLCECRWLDMLKRRIAG